MIKNFIKKISLLLIVSLTFTAWGCAAKQAKKVDLCENKQCGAVESTTQMKELLEKLYQVLKNNLNRYIDLYPTDPQKREILKRGLGFHIQVY
jgi:hypothetical protein